MSFQYGVDRVPTSAPQTPIYEPGAPFEGVTLPLYHHEPTYEAAKADIEKLFHTLRINAPIEGGNIVVCFGPDNGINAFRAQ